MYLFVKEEIRTNIGKILKLQINQNCLLFVCIAFPEAWRSRLPHYGSQWTLGV